MKNLDIIITEAIRNNLPKKTHLNEYKPTLGNMLGGSTNGNWITRNLYNGITDMYKFGIDPSRNNLPTLDGFRKRSRYGNNKYKSANKKPSGNKVDNTSNNTPSNSTPSNTGQTMPVDNKKHYTIPTRSGATMGTEQGTQMGTSGGAAMDTNNGTQMGTSGGAAMDTNNGTPITPNSSSSVPTQSPSSIKNDNGKKVKTESIKHDFFTMFNKINETINYTDKYQ